MSFHSPPRTFARFRISWLPLDSCKKSDQLGVPTRWHNKRTFPSPFLLAHGGTSSSGALPRVSNDWLAHNVRHDMGWDDFDFCFHPKMRAQIGSVTSAQDVRGQQCLDQSSVQLHSRTLELSRNLILVLRAFLVSHAVSGRAFSEHRKTIQQASQLSFGYIVPCSLPRPFSLITTRSTIFKFECAFFVLGTAQLVQEQGRFAHNVSDEFSMCFESSAGTPLVEVLKRQPSTEKCFMDGKDVLHENVNCFGAVETTSLQIRSEAVKNAPSYGGPPVLRTNPEHRTHHRCHVCGGRWKQDMKTSFPNCATFVVLPAQNTFLSSKATPAHVYRLPQGTKRETFRCKPVLLRWWLRCDALPDAFSPKFPICGLPRAIHQQSFFRVAAAQVCHFACLLRPLAAAGSWKALPHHKLIGGSGQIVFENRYLEEATTGVEWSDQQVTSFFQSQLVATLRQQAMMDVQISLAWPCQSWKHSTPQFGGESLSRAQGNRPLRQNCLAAVDPSSSALAGCVSRCEAAKFPSQSGHHCSSSFATLLSRGSPEERRSTFL